MFEKKDISCNQEANLICENNIKFEIGPLNGNKVEVKNTGSFAIKGFNEKPVNRIELTPAPGTIRGAGFVFAGFLAAMQITNNLMQAVIY